MDHEKKRSPPCLLVVLVSICAWGLSAAMSSSKQEEKTEATKTSVAHQQGMEEILIQGQPEETPEWSRTIWLNDVEKTPGTYGDTLRIIQSLPGIALGTTRSSAGLGLAVRGSAPEDSKVFLDGHLVPMLFHMGGFKSAVNAEMLDRVDFYPGGFGVADGGATGAVMKIKSKSAINKETHGYLEVSALDSSAFLQGPMGEDGGFLFAVRRSVFDLWASDVLKEMVDANRTVTLVYQDYQAKMEWTSNGDDYFSIFGFGLSDNTHLLEERHPEDDFQVGAQYHRLLVGWLHDPVSGNWRINTSLAFGYDKKTYLDGNRYSNAECPLMALRSDFQWEFSNRWLLSSGLYAGFNLWEADFSIARPQKEGFQTSNRDWTAGELKLTSYQSNAYISASWRMLKRTQLTGGLRAECYGFETHTQCMLMPRLSARQVIHPSTTLKASLGIYYQPAALDELVPEFGNPELAMEKAIHSILGVEQRLPWGLQLDVTLFYKTLKQLVVPSRNILDNKIYSNQGMGQVYGLELLLRKNPTNAFYGWMAYTLMRSERKDGPYREWRLFDFDQTHILTLVVGYSIPSANENQDVRHKPHGQEAGWTFGLRFQLVSGNPYTPVAGKEYAADYDFYHPIYGPTNSARLPLYHSLDLRIDHTWIFEDWTLSVFLDVQNTYSHRSIEKVEYNFDYSEQKNILGLPTLPTVGIKGRF
jgi:hypothetical protein